MSIEYPMKAREDIFVRLKKCVCLVWEIEIHFGSVIHECELEVSKIEVHKIFIYLNNVSTGITKGLLSTNILCRGIVNNSTL